MSLLRYLGSDISYEEDRDISKNINNYQRIYGTIRKILKGKSLRETQMKFYMMIIDYKIWQFPSYYMESSEIRLKVAARLNHMRHKNVRKELRVQKITELEEEMEGKY